MTKPVAILLSLAVVLSGAMAQARDLSVSDVMPRDYPTAQAVAYMGKLISERTGGRYRITPLGLQDQDSGMLVVGRVKNAALDMAHVSLSPFDGIAPLTIVPTLPYLFKSAGQARRVLDGPVGDEILATLEDQGFIGLCFYDTGARSFYTTKRPIRNVTDMKGLKLRLPEAAWAIAMARATGANVTVTPVGMVRAALGSNLIDAADNNLPSYVALRHYEVAKNFSLTEHSRAPSVLVFSKRVWDGISKDDQTVIRNAAKESVLYMRTLWDEAEASARKVAGVAGVQFITDVDKNSFSEVFGSYYSVVLTDPKQRDLVKRINDTK